MSFPIVEYQTWPEWTNDGLVWTKRISVDLRWVAAAKPWAEEEGVEIAFCGGSAFYTIRALYEDFMWDWVRAKGLSL